MNVSGPGVNAPAPDCFFNQRAAAVWGHPKFNITPENGREWPLRCPAGVRRAAVEVVVEHHVLGREELVAVGEAEGDDVGLPVGL